ncbi:hypothetical protein [Sediminitomix flava]|uniref:Outer membrane lipoprotein-sorting protein n=1 Tax=Sediminitomix flava TaxID=379075 RepID=A0A315ZA65_SEDFL|nr:hypothetical protein [Sediminitomix flava]PWJ41953.1 hypothetical protein BC781_103203 [Sediminitomix flava]
MKNLIFILTLSFLSFTSFSQEIDAVLSATKNRLDAIQSIDADVKIDIDVPHIQMPTKSAKLHYKKDKPTKLESKDFLMVPRKGLDFTLESLFKFPFITADRGLVEVDGISCRQINVIPTDSRSDFAIALLTIDTKNHRILKSEVSTKKEGSYQTVMAYANEEAIVPSAIEVNFEMDKLRIPLSFMGKNIEVDKKALKESGEIEGKIFIKISNPEVQFN